MELKNIKDEKKNELLRIAIVGESSNKRPISKEIYVKAKENLIAYLSSLKLSSENIILVSGGCSGIDHLAVLLFQEFKFSELHLYLPCVFDSEKQRFDNKGSKYMKRAADELNRLHTLFSSTVGRNTFQDLDNVIKNNCKINTSFGFFKRNDMIASNCDLMIAMSFGKNTPNDGGTRYTWNKFSGNKIHISLNTN